MRSCYKAQTCSLAKIILSVLPLYFWQINPYKAYIKGKFIISLNYNTAEIYYTKFRSYILLDLFRLVAINNYKGIKYLFTLLDIVVRIKHLSYAYA